MENALSKLLSMLPAPMALAVAVALAGIWLLVTLDNLRVRRRLENAKLEREVWALELGNAQKALDLRRAYLGCEVSDVDGAVMAELLARGELYSTLGKSIDDDQGEETKPYWRLSSDEPTAALRALEIGCRYAFGIFGLGLLLTIVARIALDVLGLRVDMTWASDASGVILLGGLVLMLVWRAMKFAHWISGTGFDPEGLELSPKASIEVRVAPVKNEPISKRRGFTAKGASGYPK